MKSQYLIISPTSVYLSAFVYFILFHILYGRSGIDYWFALYKRTATPDGTTYWLDGNPSTYRWWISDDPNEDVRCILYTHHGFRDRSCSREFQYTCKIAAGTNLLLLGSWDLHDYFNNGQPQNSSFCWDFCIIETIRFRCIITMLGLNQKNAPTLLLLILFHHTDMHFCVDPTVTVNMTTINSADVGAVTLTEGKATNNYSITSIRLILTRKYSM